MRPCLKTTPPQSQDNPAAIKEVDCRGGNKDAMRGEGSDGGKALCEFPPILAHTIFAIVFSPEKTDPER